MQQSDDYTGESPEKTVYVLLIVDRHTEPEPFVHMDKDIALEDAKETAEYLTNDHGYFPKEEKVEGYLYYATYSPEGDYVSVETADLYGYED